MGLLRCPTCGALSPATQRMCPQCETRLDLGPAQQPPASQAAVPEQVCKQCKYANVFAPVGVKLAAQDIWCALVDQAKPADGAASDCFELSFTWRREESMD